MPEMENYLIKLQSCHNGHMQIHFDHTQDCPLCKILSVLKDLEKGINKSRYPIGEASFVFCPKCKENTLHAGERCIRCEMPDSQKEKNNEDK